MVSLTFAAQTPLGSSCFFDASSNFSSKRPSSVKLALGHNHRNWSCAYVAGPSYPFSLQSFPQNELATSSSFVAFDPVASQAPPAVQKAAEADVMGLLLRERIVFLGCSLDDFAADAIISQLLLLDAQDPHKDIRLFINSSGGTISAAMGVFDAIQLCRAPVSTIVFGFAASTAAILLAAGTKGKRFAMPNSRIMVHQPMGGASGQAIDVEIQAKEIMYHKTNIARILSQITGRTYEQIEAEIDRDRYFSPLEAVEYGIIDGVIDKDAILSLAPLPEKIVRRSDYKDAEENPRKFLIPEIPDDEIY